jgi:hypothetical protein
MRISLQLSKKLDNSVKEVMVINVRTHRYSQEIRRINLILMGLTL